MADASSVVQPAQLCARRDVSPQGVTPCQESLEGLVRTYRSRSLSVDPCIFALGLPVPVREDVPPAEAVDPVFRRRLLVDFAAVLKNGLPRGEEELTL